MAIKINGIKEGPAETAAQALGDSPKKIKIEFFAKTRYAGSMVTRTEEFDADATDDEIDDAAIDICAEMVETGWVKRGFVD